MKKNDFWLSNKTPIVLYGAAAVGCLLYEKLSGLQYGVIGFIDKRGEEIGEIFDVPVSSLEKMNYPKDVVIIIAVKNVFEHTRIANDLIKRGYHNLIYRPYSCLVGCGNAQEEIINQIYDQILEKDLRDFKGATIPMSQEIRGVQLANKAMIKSNKDFLTVLLPMTLLFTDKKIDREGNISPEIPVLYLLPHIKFIKCVLGMDFCNPYLYVKYCEEAAERINKFEITELWKKNVVRNRAEVVNNMNHLYDVNYQFFVEQAPLVQWNKKGYFNLCSGKHRSVFLVTKGKNYLPVKMSKADFEEWLNVERVNEIQNYINKNGVIEFNAPIENPFFYDVPCVEEHFLYQFIRVAVEKIAEHYYENSFTNSLKGKKIFICLEDGNFCRRYFERCECEVYIKQKVNKFDELIDKLLQLNIVERKEKNEYDIAIVDERYDIKILKADMIFIITRRKEKDIECLFSGIHQGEPKNIYLKTNDN